MSIEKPVIENKTFLGHPLGLFVLFFTEMWERFSYYGMRALLITYMVNYFKWEQGFSSSVYKWYTTLVYVTPIIGGFLADRYLGNTWAVIIGGVLMAVGHFLMAFEAPTIFYAALIFLIIGNGFFKPNMSTQVGRLYPANDRRRDGAYTIFYMGINLGAFLSPLACGWLKQNTVGGYHSGFALAGIGMVIGLVTYLVGLPFINEHNSGFAKPKDIEGSKQDVEKPISEQEADIKPSVLGGISDFLVNLLLAGALFLMGTAVWLGIQKPLAAAPPLISGLSLLIVYWISKQVRNATRDRVLTIIVLGFFVIFFWAAFEQAGNALNLWADKTTNRWIMKPMPPENKYPDAAAEIDPIVKNNDQKFEGGFWNMFALKKDREGGALGFDPVPTEWFQSINALGIFLLAPLFAWLWFRWDISVPMKMSLGIFAMGLSVLVMLGGAFQENRPLEVVFKGNKLPDCIEVAPAGNCYLVGKNMRHPIQAGRLIYDANAKVFKMRGVFADNERDLVARESAPKEFQDLLDSSNKEIKKFANSASDGTSVEFKIPATVQGFDFKYSGLPTSVVAYDSTRGTLTLKKVLAEKDIKALQLCAADPDFRDSMDQLYVQSAYFKVSPMWLVVSYILATIGELCLSPVGLSMANKLAPAKYSTMLMGLWLLVSAFGNFAAGALGEVYGTITPQAYFAYTTLVLVVAALVLFVGSKKLTSMMHGVK